MHYSSQADHDDDQYSLSNSATPFNPQEKHEEEFLVLG
jgi:hypothetical protein